MKKVTPIDCFYCNKQQMPFSQSSIKYIKNNLTLCLKCKDILNFKDQDEADTFCAPSRDPGEEG